MKKILFFLMFSALAAAQVSPPSTQSRVAGRFVAYNYGVWSLPVYTMPSGTGSQTFTLSNSTARLQDGRVIMPFAVNAPLRVGSETVTVTAVGAGCIINSTVIGGCSITATFTLPHTVADPVASGTWGLQEALNDAAASGGGTVTVDSAWTARGGTSGMVSAATIPSSTGIEDERTGPGGYPGVTSDGAGGLNVTGTLVAGTAVVAPSDSSSSANDTISGLQILEDANGLPAAQTGIIIAGDNYGSQSSNAAAIDIFPNGTVPWSQAGLIFEDLATQNNSAIILGRGTDPASQGISFISGSFANFPLVSHLYANNGEILMPSEAGMIPGIYTPSLGCGNNLNGSSECYFDAEGRADFGYLHGNAFIQAGLGHYIDFDWNEASGPSASAKAWFDNGSTSLTMNQLHIDAITSPANGTVTFFNPGSYPFTGTSIGLAPNATGAGQIVQAVPAGTNCSNTYECVVVQLVHGATLGASNSETFGFSTGSGSPSQLLSIFGNGDVTIGNSGVDGGSKLYDDGSFSALSANITGLGSSTLPLCTTTGGRITNSGCALGTSPTIVSPTITGAVTFSGGSISTGGTLNFSGLKGNYIASSNNGSVSGCSLTASTGGGSAGKFVSGTSGTCTVTVTSSVTVANGYACWANDITTPADTLHQTAYTTTTSTISGTTVSGDVIVWGCLAF